MTQQIIKLKLNDTDYVLFKDGKTVEPLDCIYGESSVNEIIANGFKLEEGECWAKMTWLPTEWQEKYLDSLEENYKSLGFEVER